MRLKGEQGAYKHSVVVITSALHAEGRGFNPHCLYSFCTNKIAFIYNLLILKYCINET